jgi:hypothetical protein
MYLEPEAVCSEPTAAIFGWSSPLAGPPMPANLPHSRRRVQQLFVRLIFLPGISDRNKPTPHRTFRSANRFADGQPPLQTHPIKHQMAVSSALSASTCMLNCGESDYWARRPTPCQGRVTRRPSRTGVKVVFGDQSLSPTRSLPNVSGQTSRFIWSLHTVRLLFLPGISRGRKVVGHRD